MQYIFSSQAGFEPAALRLLVTCSAAKPLRRIPSSYFLNTKGVRGRLYIIKGHNELVLPHKGKFHVEIQGIVIHE
jgi:hypothetical protein